VRRFAAASHFWRALPVGLADWAWQRRGRSLLTRAARDVPAYANLLRIFADSPEPPPRLQTSHRSYVQIFPLEQRGRRGWQRQVVSFDPSCDASAEGASATAASRSPCHPVILSPCRPLEAWPRARDELHILRQHLIGLLDTWFDITRRRTLLALALPQGGWCGCARISQALQSAIAASRLSITVTDLTEARSISPSRTPRVPGQNPADARPAALVAPPVAPLVSPETVFRLVAGFEQCIVLTDPAGAAAYAAYLTQLPMLSGLMIFGLRTDAPAPALPPSVPTCSVLGADEVGPLIAVETPLSRLIFDLCRTHPSLHNIFEPKGLRPEALYQPLPRGPWLEQAGNDLLVTSWGAAPVVRYRLGWPARLLTYSHLCDVLSREKVLPPRHLKQLTRIESPAWKLPLIAMANR
jgi:hypothetical protein